MTTTRWPIAPQQEYMIAKQAYHLTDRAVRFRNPFLALHVNGPFDVDRIAAALAVLIRQHEVLRAELNTTTNASLRVRDELDPPLDVIQECWDPEKRLAEQEWQRFDPGRAPLWRVAVFRLGPDSHIVSFTFCHLIWDGASMRSFLSLLAREYTDPGSTRPSGQYLDFVEAARTERERRADAPWDPAILTAVAEAVRMRQTLKPEVIALDLRHAPFEVGREAMDRWRQSASVLGTEPFLRFLGVYLAAAAAEFDCPQLITGFASSRVDLRPGEDSLGYFSDLSLAVVDTRAGTGDQTAPCLITPALSWSELTGLVGPMTYPQEIYDVWARGPVFTSATDLTEIFPGTRTAALPLTPGWRMSVTDVRQRRVLSGPIVPSLIVDDLRRGAGYLEFNAAVLPWRSVRRLIKHLANYIHNGPKG